VMYFSCECRAAVATACRLQVQRRVHLLLQLLSSSMALASWLRSEMCEDIGGESNAVMCEPN